MGKFWPKPSAEERLNAVILSEGKSNFGTPMMSIGPQKSGILRSRSFNELWISFLRFTQDRLRLSRKSRPLRHSRVSGNPLCSGPKTDPRFRWGDDEDDFHSLGRAATPWVLLRMTPNRVLPQPVKASATVKLGHYLQTRRLRVHVTYLPYRCKASTKL